MNNLRLLSISGLALIAAFAAAADGRSNVTADLKGHVLVVRGDNNDNNFSIDRISGGVKLTGYAGTKINGRDEYIVRDSELIKLDVQTNGGDDRVIATDLRLSSSAIFNLGSGDDYVRTSNLDLGGSLKLNGGNGRDTFVNVGTNVDADLSIDGGSDQSDIDSRNSKVGLDFNIVTEDRGDEVNLGSTRIGGNLNIETGRGDDDLDLRDLNVGSKFKLNTEEGEDNVFIANLKTQLDIDIKTGSQNDRLAIVDVNAKTDLKINLEDGNDFFRSTRSGAGERALTFGGGGLLDLFLDFGFSGGLRTAIDQFEK